MDKSTEQTHPPESYTVDFTQERLNIALRELAELKAAPRIEVTKHDDPNDPHYPLVTIRTEWMGYGHQSMCDGFVWKTESKYRDHLFRTAMESVIRAHAEAQTPVIDEKTYNERWLDRRTR